MSRFTNMPHYKRFYFKLDVPTKIQGSHITLVEAYVSNFASVESNKIWGYLNSNVSGIQTLREKTINILNEKQMEFHPESLALIGNSEHLGVKMRVVSNDEKYGFQELVQQLNEHIFRRLSATLVTKSLTIIDEIVKPGSISFTRYGNEVTNDTSWLVKSIKDDYGNVIMYIRTYAPAIPHISISNINDFIVKGDYYLAKKEISTDTGVRTKLSVTC